MKKRFVQVVMLTLALAVCLGSAAQAASGTAIDQTLVRIGLSYGSATVVSGTLTNSTGSGFRLGYFDSSNAFVSLMETGETAISALKTHNLYLTSSGSYSTTDAGKGAVGCYHIQLPGSYADGAAAAAAALAVSDGFPAWVGSTWYVRSGSYTSRAAAQTAADAVAGATVGETSQYGISVTAAGTTRILFQIDDQGSGTGLGVEPISTGGKTVTKYGSATYYGSFRFQRVGGGSLTVVNILPLGDYVKGVIPYEMSSSWPLEALKAQAVCARTYALCNLNKHKSYGFDLCSVTDCQVYKGTASATTRTDSAVDGTAGVTVQYNGSYATTFFFSSDGGGTESSENVWVTAYPYLKGVIDPYEADVADKISNYNWTVTFTAQELTAKLQASGRNCSTIVSAQVTKRTETGNVYTVTFVDDKGKEWSISKEPARTIFGLRSLRYDITGSGGQGDDTLYVNGGSSTIQGTDGAYAIDGSGNVTAITGDAYVITGDGVDQTGQSAQESTTFTFAGSGWGHSVGMSQWGAYAMANRGYTYDQILKFYFTGVTVTT